MNAPDNGAGRPGKDGHAQDRNDIDTSSIPLEAFKVKGFVPSRVFFYREHDGTLAGAVARFEAGTLEPDDKTFRQFRREGQGFKLGLNDKALPLYRLPALVADPAAVVLWVEGEKCADKLAGLGFVVTTTVGGAKGFAAWLRKNPVGADHLAGRDVVLLGDNDEDGRFYVRTVADALLAAGCRVRVLDPLPWADIGNKADVFNWIEAGHDATELRELIANTADYASQASGQSEHLEKGEADPADGDDLALPAEHPVLHPDALHGIAGEFVTACRPHCESHDAGVLFSFLTLIGCCCGADLKAPVVYVGADKHHARLFSNLVGPTGRGRKGTAWGPVRRLQEVLTDMDDAFGDTAQADFNSLGLQPDSVVATRRPGSPHLHDGGLSSGEGIIYRIRDEREVGQTKPKKGEQPEPIIDHGEADKRLLVYQSEFGSVLRMSGRDGNTLADILRTGWDGMTLSPLTKNNRICASRPHLCIVANVTSEELRQLLDDCGFFNGFVNRFLWIAVRRARWLPFPDPIPDDVLGPLAQRVRRAILAARGRIYGMDPKAKAAWPAIYRELETRKLAGLTAKATERASPYVLRLALIYAILDEAPEIRLVHLTAACAAWRYAQDSAAYIFGRVADVLGADAQRIVEMLQAAGGELALSKVWAGFKGHIDKERMEKALAQLAERGLAEVIEEPTRGRPRRILREL